jgi:hypothetical protein
MAKICEVCKRPYPDESPTCPHCSAEVIEVTEDAVVINPPDDSSKLTVGPGSSSEVDLGAPGSPVGSSSQPVDPSGVSVVEWASLVEDPPSQASSLSSVRIDSPSDQDLRRADAGAPTAPHPGPTPAGHPPAGTAPTVEVPPPAARETVTTEKVPDRAAGDSGVDLGAPPPDAPEAPMIPREQARDEDDSVHLASGDSGVDLASGVVVEVGSEPDLGPGSSSKMEAPAGGPHPGAPAQGPDSGIDLEAEAVVEHAGPALPAGAGDSGIDLVVADLGSGVGLGSSGRDSGRDLIAEAVESGVDLVGEGEQPPSGSSDVRPHLGTEAPAAEEESSSVDLGSLPNVSLPAEMKDKKRPPSAGKVALPHQQVPAEEEPPSARVDLFGYEDEQSKPSVARKSESDVDLEGEGPPPTVGDSGVVVEYEPGEGSAAARQVPRSEVRAADEPTASEMDVRQQEAAREAAAEIREEEARAEEEEEKPREERRRGRAGALVGGVLLGGLLAAGVCFALWLKNIVPSDSTLGLVGLSGPKKEGPSAKPGPGPEPRPGPGTTQPPAATPETVVANVRNGDLDKVSADDLARLDASKPEHLLARADYYWLGYLRQQSSKGPGVRLDANDKAVKQALADLDAAVKAGSADALFQRGQVHELTGSSEKAKADYQQGLKLKDETQRARFENALLSLELRNAKSAPAISRGPRPPAVTPEALLVVLLTLQQPGGAGEKAPAATPEAGFKFWEALKLARERKYDEAVKALKEARARHDRRRFAHLRKQQNPLSDPTEEIFLRCCDELKAYWEAAAKLNNPRSLEAGAKTGLKSVDKLLARADENGRAAQLKELADRLAKGKSVKSPDELVAAVESQRKGGAGKVAELTKELAAAGKKAERLAGELKEAKGLAEERGDKLKAAEGRERTLKAANAEALAALKQVAEAAESKFTDVKDRDRLAKEVGEKVRLGKVSDPSGRIRKLQEELARDRAKLKERWEPGQMLGFWLSALQDRARVDLAPNAVRDAERVLADRSATAQDKGKAELIRGLALRNEEKYDRAKVSLEKARPALKGAGREWREAADEALKEVSNPGAYYAGRAEELYGKGDSEKAREALKRGMEVLPKEKGRLLARRSLIALEKARTKGTLSADDPLVEEARQDADAAAKQGSAEGHYAAGRIAEELGRWGEAVSRYRAAVKAHPGLDDAGSRYRAALARALLRSGSEDASRPSRRSSSRLPARGDRSRDAAVLLLALALQAPGAGESSPDSRREAEKLADEILAAGDKVPFDVRAQALAVKGLYTPALRTYVAGLREKRLLPAGYANGLLDLIDSHPALQRPSSRRTPDPNGAERHFAAGVNLFFDRKYAGAEKELLSAVEQDGGDARYFYFLGLARLAQGKREAYQDFDQGASLERSGHPSRAAVSAALERVQGRMRRELNAVRTRPAREEGR